MLSCYLTREVALFLALVPLQLFSQCPEYNSLQNVFSTPYFGFIRTTVRYSNIIDSTPADIKTEIKSKLNSPIKKSIYCIRHGGDIFYKKIDTRDLPQFLHSLPKEHVENKLEHIKLSAQICNFENRFRSLNIGVLYPEARYYLDLFVEIDVYFVYFYNHGSHYFYKTTDFEDNIDLKNLIIGITNDIEKQ